MLQFTMKVASMRVCLLATFTLMLTLTSITQVEGRCKFPEVLTRRSRWETQMVEERVKTNAFFKFHESKFEVRDYSSEDKRMEVYMCERELPDDKFVLKMDYKGPGGNEKFFCMQIIVRSEQIVQRKLSEVHGSITDDICEDLKLDDWPMVWPEMRDSYSECPFSGGFSFELEEYMNGVLLCKNNNWLKPRLESECIKGEGITIDFQTLKCLGSLGMELVQKLGCLGSWEDGDFIFTIISDLDVLWPRLWMIRLPKNTPVGEPIHAVLSKDIVADRSQYFGQDGLVPLDRLYEMILTTELYPSLCENEAHDCNNLCGDRNEFFCQKDCGVCDPEETFSHCQFDPETRGQWEEISGDDDRKTIIVTESMLYPHDLFPFQCYELRAEKWYEGTGRRALATLFKNGCKPRYTCAEFMKQADDVMTYRLSQSLVWPATMYVNADTVCPEERFVKDPKPLGDKYRSKETKVLVKKTAERKSVSCDLGSSFGLSGITKDGKRLLAVLWSAVVGSEGSSDSIIHEVCPLGEANHSIRTLRCLASYFPDNATQFLIVEQAGKENIVECWIIHTYPWERHPRVMVLNPGHCSPDTPINVDYGSDRNFLAKYELLELDDSIKDPCTKWKSSSPLDQFSHRPTVYPAITIPGTVEDAVVDEQKEGVPNDWSIKVAGLKSGKEYLHWKSWVLMLGLGLYCLAGS